MKLEINDLAAVRLQESLGDQPGIFKLFVDTEGCGCNGMIVIQIINEPLSTDLEIDSQPFAFVCDRQQESIFDEVMRLGADENYPSYKLTSDSNTFGTNIKLIDKRL